MSLPLLFERGKQKASKEISPLCGCPGSSNWAIAWSALIGYNETMAVNSGIPAWIL